MNRILVIRGGAIGDFILTLPALKVLRDAYSDAHIEILGYKHIAVLGENRFYAQAVRSIEYSALSSFFAKNSEPSAELANYFASFDLVISYLYDPDRIFESNLRRCGVDELIQGPAHVNNHEHAARQLARPLEQLALFISDFAAKLYPSVEDRRVAGTFLGNCAQPIVALHPGSGSERKNWPLANWIALGNYLLHFEDFPGSLLIISGEADEERTRQLQTVWKDDRVRVRFAKNLPLPKLAALLENTIFAGHDSGISHLAAGAGARCILLFGPTDPDVWAPRNENVRVLRAPNGNMHEFRCENVRKAMSLW